jgi:hypothetical protein
MPLRESAPYVNLIPVLDLGFMSSYYGQWEITSGVYLNQQTQGTKLLIKVWRSMVNSSWEVMLWDFLHNLKENYDIYFKKGQIISSISK